jgi:cell division protein FtsQ
LLFAILSTIILGALSVTVLFNASDVVVKGESIYSDEEIMSVAGIELGTNLTRFDSEGAQANIMSTLINLDDASIRKVYGFPSRIEVTVEKSQGIFSFLCEGEYREVSRNGRIIGSLPNQPETLIVTGISSEIYEVGEFLSYEDNEQITLAFELIRLIEKHELTDVHGIDIADKFDIKMFYDDERIEVRLGSPTQLEEKFMGTGVIVSEQIDKKESGVLRISNPNKASFKARVVN